MRNSFRFVLVLILIMVLAVGVASGQEGSSVETRLISMLDGVRNEAGAPGMVLYLSASGGEKSVASGMAVVENKGVPMEPDMAFRIASISKTFTAASVLLMARAGLVDLDSPIDAYIPELKIPKGDIITLNHLLRHQSGLWDHNNDVEQVQGILDRDPEHEFSPAELVACSARFTRENGFHFEPGQGFRYCDTGYTILALIVEKMNIEGLSFDGFVKKKLLVPFGLEHTFMPQGGWMPKDCAHGYLYVSEKGYEDVTGVNQSFEFGCGGMVSTVVDLGRWARLLYGGKALGTTWTQRMMEVSSTGDVQHPWYGLGCAWNPLIGYGHNGGTLGYMSLMRYEPETDTAVVVFMNQIAEDYSRFISGLYTVAYESREVLGLNAKPADPLDGFAAFVEEARDEYRVPGAAVAVVQGDRVVFERGFGVCDVKGTRPVDKDTRFQLASVSKLITALSIGRLKDHGLLEWDMPVAEFIPGFTMGDSSASKVTFRDLLAHRSGLGAYDGDLLGRYGYDLPEWRKELMRRVRYLKRAYPFRQAEQYSNVGFAIAGYAGGQASNSTWEGNVNELLRSLDMDRSSPWHRDLFSDDNHVTGHQKKKGRAVPMVLESCSMFAGGEVVSTLDDMTRLVRMLLAGGNVPLGRVLRSGTVEEIFAPVIANGMFGLMSLPGAANGLGCNSFPFLQYTVVEKNGALDGVRTLVTLVPELDLGLVVLCNMHLTVFPEAVRCRFLEDWLGASGRDMQGLMRDMQARVWDQLILDPEFPEDPKPFILGLNVCAGTYESDLYGLADVSRKGEGLVLTMRGPGGQTYSAEMLHWDGDLWYLQWPDPDDAPGLVRFLAGDDGRVTGFEGTDKATALISQNYGTFTKQ